MRAHKPCYRPWQFATHPDRRGGSAEQFSLLQHAWERYQAGRPHSARETAPSGNFTTFGVGCSFADDEFERAHRSSIVEQASRGYLHRDLLDSHTASEAVDSAECAALVSSDEADADGQPRARPETHRQSQTASPRPTP